MRSQPSRAILLLVTTVFLSGCGSKNKPVDVEGIVLLDNAPVAEATVLFIPEGNTGQPAYGMTDENGKFQLSTFKENDGAIPGNYKVTVSKSIAPPQPPEAEPGDSKSIVAHFRAMMDKKKVKSPLPTMYANEKTTPFHYTVPVEGKLTLELKSPGK